MSTPTPPPATTGDIAPQPQPASSTTGSWQWTGDEPVHPTRCLLPEEHSPHYWRVAGTAGARYCHGELAGAGRVGSGEPTRPTMDLGAINVVGRVLIEQGVDFSEYEGDRTALVPVGRTARAIVQALDTWRDGLGVDHA